MKTFRIHAKLTDREQYRFALLHIARSGVMRRVVPILFIPFILITITLTMGPAKPSGALEFLLPLSFPVLLLLILFVGPLIYIKLRRREDALYEFNDWGMVITRDSGTHNVPWTDLDSYNESAHYIVVGRTVGRAFAMHVLPKKEFSGEEEIREFIGMLIQQRLKRR